MSSSGSILSSQQFHLNSEQRARLESERGLSTDGLLRLLVEEVRRFALVPISDFRVGSAGVTKSGEVFLGVNLEFVGASFAQTVHSEQFLISLSRTFSDSPLVKMAVSAPPCGHCRQFAAEFDPHGELELLIADEESVRLKELLPRAFTPADLQVQEKFFCQALNIEGCNVEEAATRAAVSSYVPYSRTRAGAAVKDRDGRIFAGAALENAAYNPALPPLQAALITAFAGGCAIEDIREVVLCQERGGLIDYEPQLRDLARCLHEGDITFRTVLL